MKLTNRARKSWIPIFEMSTPSIKILPSVGSTNRKILIANVLFPEPVRPNKPILSPGFSVNDTSCRTAGNSGAYLMTKFSTDMRSFVVVLDGQ